MNDPYPATLAEIDDTSLGFAPKGNLAPLVPDGNLAALNRIATALEQIALNLMDKPVSYQPPRAPLAALPPVQVVGDKPACPHHGLDKVRTSDKGPGFYCSAKAQPGQPQNPRGYCTWHS